MARLQKGHCRSLTDLFQWFAFAEEFIRHWVQADSLSLFEVDIIKTKQNPGGEAMEACARPRIFSAHVNYGTLWHLFCTLWRIFSAHVNYGRLRALPEQSAHLRHDLV